MSIESLDELLDGKLDYEDGLSEENGSESKYQSDSSAAEKPVIVQQEKSMDDVSVFRLLEDYVVINMTDDDWKPRLPIYNSPDISFPPTPRDRILDFIQTPRSETTSDGRRSECEYMEYEDAGSEKGELGDSEVDESDDAGSNENEIEDIRSVSATVRLERVRLPELGHSGSEIYIFEETTYQVVTAEEIGGDSQLEAGEESPPIASPSSPLLDGDADENEDNVDEEVDGFSSDDDNIVVPVANERSYEGNMSATRASNSRLSALNSNLYKTDGEDLSDVMLTRSFAYLHQKEIVEAGAKTIGELYVGLKRRKALESSNSDENADNRNTDSPLLINKRRDENEKLKNKNKTLPKSTIPFEEKPVSKVQVKSALDDKPIATQKKFPPNKASAKPSTVTTNSEIHVEPEVRGDMGSPKTVAPSVESLTPESLTLLCRAETGIQSSDRDKSVDPELDSRAGFISGRQNPQAKDIAALKETKKSRIPLPVERKKGESVEQDRQKEASVEQDLEKEASVKHDRIKDAYVKQNRKKETSVGQGSKKDASVEQDRNSSSSSSKKTNKPKDVDVTALAPVGSYWVTQKPKPPAVTDTRRSRFKTRTLKLDNPAELMTKGTTLDGDRKPPIPHQMRSVACYHNGRLDVAILGDRDLLAENDPLDVQITLVPQIKNNNPSGNTHQPVLPPLKKKASEESKNMYSRKPGLPPLRNPPPLKKSSFKGNVVKKKDDLSKSKKTSHNSPDHRVKSSKQLPPLRRVDMKYMLSAKRNKGGCWSPSKKRMEDKKLRDKVRKTGNQQLPDVDWDVVTHRAQYPPFNTYTDPEASQRFQKAWCGL